MIRWIDNALGTAAFEDPATEGHVKLDVRSLVDGPTNKPDALRERIETGLDLLGKTGRLVVCCDFGVSRSNTIASAILARRDGLAFDEAFALVRRRVGETRMDYGIAQAVRAALEPGPLPELDHRRVLVTGGTGFLGRWLERIAGNEIELVRLGSRDFDLTASPFELDAAVRRHRPGVVIHLANPRIFHTHEVVGKALAMLRNVADVCAQHGAFLVYPSSWIVFSGRKSEDADGVELREDAEPLPSGNHAMSKALAERMLGYLRQTTGLGACVLRFTPVYGPGSLMPRFLFHMAEQGRAGCPLVTHVYQNGRPRLQLLHARDAARALIRAASARAGGIFHIGGGEAPSTRELAALIAEVTRSAPRFEEVELSGRVANVILDTARAREVLGWTPEIGLSDGLHELLARPAAP